MDFSQYFTSLGAMVPAVVVVTAFLTNFFKLKGTWANVASWGTGVVLAFAAHFLGFGFLADLSLVWVGIYGVSASLAANGIVSVDALHGILEFFKLKLPSASTTSSGDTVAFETTLTHP